jgi:hypothetical protein
MLLTCHWSGSDPGRLRAYHGEFGDNGGLNAAIIAMCKEATKPSEIDWLKLRAAFNVWKNDDLTVPTEYGTYHINHDPRDGSSNIEVAAMCMGGDDVNVPGPWGQWPYTFAHAWMHAGVVARICQIKGLDTGGSFDASVDPGTLQNGPIYVVSTHGERAWQTTGQGVQTTYPSRGYAAYSTDTDPRFDCMARDVSLAGGCVDFDSALASTRSTAAWIRETAHAIKLAGITDLWNLDKAST